MDAAVDGRTTEPVRHGKDCPDVICCPSREPFARTENTEAPYLKDDPSQRQL